MTRKNVDRIEPNYKQMWITLKRAVPELAFEGDIAISDLERAMEEIELDESF